MTEVIKTSFGDICVVPSLRMPEGAAALITTLQTEGDSMKYGCVIVYGTQIVKFDVIVTLKITFSKLKKENK